MKEFRGGPGRYGELGLSERRTRGRWLRRECLVARLSPARFWSRWSRWSSWSSWSSSSSSCCSPALEPLEQLEQLEQQLQHQRSEEIAEEWMWRLCGARVTLIAQRRVPSTALPMPGTARGSPWGWPPVYSRGGHLGVAPGVLEGPRYRGSGPLWVTAARTWFRASADQGGGGCAFMGYGCFDGSCPVTLRNARVCRHSWCVRGSARVPSHRGRRRSGLHPLLSVLRETRRSISRDGGTRGSGRRIEWCVTPLVVVACP